jgi:hypothetical protein
MKKIQRAIEEMVFLRNQLNDLDNLDMNKCSYAIRNVTDTLYTCKQLIKGYQQIIKERNLQDRIEDM